MQHTIRMQWATCALIAGSIVAAAVPALAQQRTEEQPSASESASERSADDNERRSQDERNQPSRENADRREPSRFEEGRTGQDRQRGAQAADSRNGRQEGFGIQFDDRAEEGLVVANIEQQSAAAQAGLRTGDRIVTVDGRRIGEARQFESYLNSQRGRRVPVVVQRGNRQYTVQLVAGQTSDRGQPEQEEDGAWLGVFLQQGDENEQGVRVTQVYPAGPAARAGLRAGDVIVRVNDQDVASPQALIETIDRLEPRTRAALVIERNNQEREVDVQLGSRQAFAFQPVNWEEDDRDDRGDDGRGQAQQEDPYDNVPPFAMQLEHDRRMAEQHQRIEQELVKLQEEVRQLRALIERNNQ
ncbi:MAG: PDZ domain-containing protein [Pirellulaceae bacterium]